MTIRTLVLGGTGLLGSALKEIEPDWIYVGSKDCDLTSTNQTEELIYSYSSKPLRVLNLAAKVGGIKLNTENQFLMFRSNFEIMNNVLLSCVANKVEKLGTCLSMCVFPEYKDDEYPITEKDFYGNKLVDSNLGYAMAKRVGYELTLLARQGGFNYIAFSPTNLFGPRDNFESETSHFVASVIRRVSAAPQGAVLEFWGSPDTLRQHLFARDAAKMVRDLFNNYDGEEPVIITSDENLKNIQMINEIIKISKKDLSYIFNGKYPGQFRKDGSNALLKSIVDYEETPLRQALEETYEWYQTSQVRG